MDTQRNEFVGTKPESPDHAECESAEKKTNSPCTIRLDDPVVHYLAAVILDGWRTADRTAEFFAQASGKKLKVRESPPLQMSLECTPPKSAYNDLLLDLGSALRIAEWERAGLREHLPTDLPTAAGSLSRIFQKVRTGGQHIPGSVAEKQFSIWLDHFALHSYETLERDVLINDGRVDVDSFIECLAAFLLEFNHLTEQEDDNVSSPT